MKGSVDVAVAEWMAAHRSGVVTDVTRFLEDLGRSPVFFAVAGLLGLAVVAVLRLWAGLLSVVVAFVVTSAVTAPLKELFDRPRPPPELALTNLYEPAMPSSHAILTSTVAVAVLMAPWWTSRTLHRVATTLAVVGCVVVALAMIYLGGHWLTDVLVGWALGVGITGAVMLLWRRLPLPGGRATA